MVIHKRPVKYRKTQNNQNKLEKYNKITSNQTIYTRMMVNFKHS